MNDQSKGLLITALGVFAVIPDSLVVRLVSVDTLSFIFWRALLAGSVILLWVFWRYGRETGRTFVALGRPGLQYAFFMAIGTLFFISALRMTSIANALFIASTSPVFAAIASRIFLGEPIRQRMVWTTFLALIGIAIIALGSKDIVQASLTGDLLAVGAAASLAFAFTAARSAKHLSVVPAAALAYCATALVAGVLTVPMRPTGDEWLWMLMLGCFFVPLGTSLMALGPRYITSAEVSLLLLLEAVLAPLLVWWVLGEDPGQWALIGGAVVLGTLFVSNLIGLRESQKRRI